MSGAKDCWLRDDRELCSACAIEPCCSWSALYRDELRQLHESWQKRKDASPCVEVEEVEEVEDPLPAYNPAEECPPPEYAFDYDDYFC